MVFARVVDFLVRVQFYHWSIKRLIFFNAYQGFDSYGALLGLIIFSFLYLKIRKADFLQIFDLAAPPLVFIQMIIYLSKLLTFNFSLSTLPKEFFYFIFYFLIFFTLKRLSTKKRHAGFFAGFYLVFISLSNLSVRLLFSQAKLQNKQEFWQMIFEVALLFFGLFLWYFLAKRKPKEDFKEIVAFVLLAIFRLKRMLTSTEEGGKFAKSILFIPLYLIRSFYLFMKLVTFEVYVGFVDFVNVFRGRK